MSITNLTPDNGFAGDFAVRLLIFFYPVHYRLGREMEKSMCQGVVDRKQSAMLWLSGQPVLLGRLLKRMALFCQNRFV